VSSKQLNNIFVRSLRGMISPWDE